MRYANFSTTARTAPPAPRQLTGPERGWHDAHHRTVRLAEDPVALAVCLRDNENVDEASSAEPAVRSPHRAGHGGVGWTMTSNIGHVAPAIDWIMVWRQGRLVDRGVVLTDRACAPGLKCYSRRA